MTALAPHLTDYLVDHLPRHRNASAHTVATYAHSFTLLVRFAVEQRRCRPIDLEVEDLDPDLILAFLDHIEAGRQNSVATRNARLAAVRSFFRYIEYKVPACLDQVLRIHALPRKRTEMRLISPFDPDQVKAELEKRGLIAKEDTGGKGDIHTALYKSFHTVTPNGFNLQISAATKATRILSSLD